MIVYLLKYVSNIHHQQFKEINNFQVVNLNLRTLDEHF